MLRRLINSALDASVQGPTEVISYSHSFTKPETTVFGWLTSVAPCFPINSNSIRIITEPKQFFETLIELSQKATYRITLASLYLGTGDLEKRLVDTVLNNEHFTKNKLKINILLDFTRGSRYEVNSRTMLQPLLQKNEECCTISLYHTPMLRGFLKKIVPNRYNELIGLQHMKLYIFDDTLVISGANLSNDYFTNRQDRYYVIKDKKLTDFYCGLVSRVQNFSLKMDKNNSVSLNENWHILPYEGSKSEFVQKAGDLIEHYLHDSIEDRNSHKEEGFDTWIFPTVQMGQLGLHQDEEITTRLLAEAQQGDTLRIASGYFNFTPQYMATLIKESKANCDILMAHPKANGFLGAEGPAGGIPFAYSLIARKFQDVVESKNQHTRIKLLEYLKKGWTYHAKGLWFYPENSSLPCLTLVGSPNFGERSVTKDLESQLIIVTENKSLRMELHKECEHLYKLGKKAETDRKVPVWVHFFVNVCRSYF